MNDRSPFQYSILRYTHDVLTGEFLNIGLVMYCRSAFYFRAQLLMRYQRITDAFPGADGEFYRGYVGHLQTRLDRVSDEMRNRQISLMEDWPDRIDAILQQVLVPDDASIKFSASRDGIAEDLDSTFEYMYSRLIERYINKGERVSRDDDEIWQVFKKPLQENGVLKHLGPQVIRTRYEEFKFRHTWRNGAINVLEPVSLDLVYGASIRQKARTWLGAAQILSENRDVSTLYLLVGKPHREGSDVQKAYSDARSMLENLAQHLKVRVVDEEDAETFAKKVKPLVEEHHH